jgi:hypothetical protein
VRASEWDAADLEAEWLPTLRRSSSLLARAFGRTGLPDWLKTREVDGTLQIDNLQFAGAPLENVRAHLLWDAARLEFDSLQGRFGEPPAAIAGKLAVNLLGARPVFRLAAAVKGLGWQSGRLDAEGTLEAAGTGRQLLASLKSEGTFSGTALDFGASPVGPGPCRGASGSFTLDWQAGGPRFHLTGLNMRTDETTYTGRGATQDDGRLLIVLSDGTREMRMTGPLSRLRVETAARP